MQGAIRLFKFSGIQVYLHFSWFIIAIFAFGQRIGAYRSPIWAAAEYIALFAIVLLHEFGHALACRQTGGQADQIVLWPLGGVAFVNPPRRPGAVLWSIAAGPLVNVVLVPILTVLVMVLRPAEPELGTSDFYRWLDIVWQINLGLLIFNMLPVYPLDGGQILRALLWFPLGEMRSLQIASVIGLFGGIALGALALPSLSFWWGLLALFVISRAIAGWQYARAMVVEKDTVPVPPDLPRV